MDTFLEKLLSIKEELENAVEILQESDKTVKPSKIKECDTAFNRYPIKTALKKLSNLCAPHKGKQNKKNIESQLEENTEIDAGDTGNDVHVSEEKEDIEKEKREETPTDDVDEAHEESATSEAMDTEVSVAVTHSPKKAEIRSTRKKSRLNKEIAESNENAPNVRKKTRIGADSEDEGSTSASPSKVNVLDVLTKKRSRTDRSEKECPVCGEKFIFQSKLTAHINEAHENTPSKSPLATDLAQEEKENIEEELEDKETDEDYIAMDEEQDNFEVEDKKPFVCEQCGKIFNQKSKLKYHMNQHKDIKPFVCHICNKTFMNSRNLRDHSTIHTGEKPFKCDSCDLSFRTKSMLRQHQATHTRPYKCKYCDSTFTKISFCNNHMIKLHGSKTIAEQLKVVKANMSLKTQGLNTIGDENNSTTENLQESQVIADADEQTIFVKIEDHTDESFPREGETEDESDQTVQEKNKDPIFTEANAIFSMDVDGENVTVFKCAICDQLYPTLPLLEEHERTHPGVCSDKEYSCDRCGKTFSTAQSLTFHQYNHTGQKPHKCSMCEKAFVSKSQLKQHENSHTLPFKCSECEERFSTKQYLARHLEKIHSILDHSEDKKRGPKGSFVCHICNHEYEFKSQLIGHMNSHEDYKPFKCGVCDKTFKAKKSLRDHTRIHTGEKPFCCETCGKSFVNQGQLQSHAATHIKPFHCQYCPKRFAIKYQWRVHETLHTHGKTHVCSECGKAYGTKSMLRNHQEKHKSDRKMYPCSECSATLGSQQALLIHRRLHRGEKPFRCKECGRCFPQRCGLTAHMRTHTGETPFKCDQCDRSFNARNTLKIHKMVHNDQRDHACEECGRGFLTKSLKDRHMATHSASKNFPCSVCGRAYYTIHALQRHKRKAHGENTTFTSQIDIKPLLQRSGGGVQDVTLADTGLTLQQIQYIQKAMGENQQAVRILQAGADNQEVKIIHNIKEESAQEVKIIPAEFGEQIVSLATGESGQAQDISFIESTNIPEGVAGVHEVTYIQQPDGSTEAIVDAPENMDVGEVQTIMVEVPFGQELDANSIMTLLQQHQQ